MTQNLATLELSAGQHDYGTKLNKANKELSRNGINYINNKDKPVKMMNPISRLPNILDSYVEVRGDNLLMERHGIKKRNASRLHLVVGTTNKKSVHYIDYIQQRLNNLIETAEAYWKFGYFVACRSRIFKSMMIQEVFPHWHRELDFKAVYIFVNSLNNNLEKLPTNLKFRRLCIPKAIDPETGEILKYRPLGVPTASWRIFLHVWQHFLMIFLKDRISNHQHGFYKGRGTKTAWEEVLTKVLSARDIYEFDLKGFFPSVNVGLTVEELRELGLPDFLCDFFFKSSLSYPSPKSILASEMDETNAIYKWELDSLGLLHTEPKAFKQRWLNEEGEYTGRVLLPILEFIKQNTTTENSGKDLLISMMEEDLGYTRREILEHWWETLYEYWQVQSALFESFAPLAKESPTPNPLGKEPKYKAVLEPQVEGFPQGSPISPILCSFILGKTVFSKAIGKVKITMYADDGMFYGELTGTESQTTALMKQCGLSFAEGKSGFVKQNGLWLKPLKYLGLTYYPPKDQCSDLYVGEFGKDVTGELRASTRKGATLSFTKEALVNELTSNNPSQETTIERDELKPMSPKFYETVAQLNESRAIQLTQQMSEEISEIFVQKEESEVTKTVIGLIMDTLLSSEAGFDLSRDFNFVMDYFAELLRSVVIPKYEIKEEVTQGEFNWERLVKSKYFGFIQSRLYQNAWSTEVTQDFSLTYKAGSWCDYHISNFNENIERIPGWMDLIPETQKRIFIPFDRKDVKGISGARKDGKLWFQAVPKMWKGPNLSNVPYLSVFNSTSYAISSLINIFEYQDTLESWRKVFKESGLSPVQEARLVSSMRKGSRPSSEVFYNRYMTRVDLSRKGIAPRVSTTIGKIPKYCKLPGKYLGQVSTKLGWLSLNINRN